MEGTTKWLSGAIVQSNVVPYFQGLLAPARDVVHSARISATTARAALECLQPLPLPLGASVSIDSKNSFPCAGCCLGVPSFTKGLAH